MEKLQTYYKMLENCIRELGVDPETCRYQKDGVWGLRIGSADMWVTISMVEGENYGYYEVISPVCQVPMVNTQEFYQEVLELSHMLYGVGMTKNQDWIYVKHIRELEGLSESEMIATLRRVGSYADDYDDYFRKKYFGIGTEQNNRKDAPGPEKK